MGRSRVASFLALPIALLAPPALAFPTSRLVYARGEGADSCPGEAAARHAVESRLGYDPFSLVADKVIVTEIVRDGDELRGRVELVDEHGLIQGVREFRAPPAQCDDLVATVALAISIAIDPTSDRVVPPLPGPPAAAPVAPPAPGAGEAPAPGAPPSSAPPAEASASHDQPGADQGPALRAGSGGASEIQARAGWSVMSSFGTAPNVALSMGASIGVRWAQFSLNLEGRGDWPASAPISTGGAARASLVAGSLVSCFHRGVFFVCGVGTVGSMHGSGEGVLIRHEGDALFVAAGARGGVEVAMLGPFFFRPQIDALANFTPVGLRVDDSQAWKAPPFSALIGAGVFASFP